VAFPDSLYARVWKAKYYPNIRLLDWAPAGDASQTWTAIEYGMELLKQGVIHRIGNGKSTHIWRDNWLPRGYGLKPIGPRRSLLEPRIDERVSLISIGLGPTAISGP
jgi:hypothetical protein